MKIAIAAVIGMCIGLAGTVWGADGGTDASGRFNVRSFGAAGDGKVLDTAAINAAIEAAAKAGGGTVYFPAGTYPSYAVHMKSNVALYLEHGAVLRAAGEISGAREAEGGSSKEEPKRDEGPAGAATAPTRGPVVEGAVLPSRTPPRMEPGVTAGAPGASGPAPSQTAGFGKWDEAEPNQWDAFQDFGHSHFRNSFIWGEDLHDISILGPGMIDGAGLLTNAGPESTIANKALALKRCRNVTLRDVTFYRGGHFCILATGVDNFTLDNLKFDTNRDAIDIVSCKNVRVSNCYVNSPTDDGICLKSDYALGEARPCENVTITNCQVSGYVMGSLLSGTFDRSLGFSTTKEGPIGRIKFGTESNGGFKNITISNCVFDHCRGLAIECVDGGVIEDVTVSNITMREINNSPLFIRLGDRARGPKEKTGVAQVRRINISNLSVQALNPNLPVLISGMEGHPIEDVRISDVRIVYPGGGTAEQAKNMPPEREEKNYPEPSRYGVLPSSAFYVRHVKGLEMHHVTVTYEKSDARPGMALVDVTGADFQHMNMQRFEDVPLFALTKVKDFSTQYVRGVADMKREVEESGMIGK